PLLGTVVFLAVTLPLTARRIMRLPHYHDQTALEALQPLVGFEYTCRSVVDNLLPGLFGVGGLTFPLPVVAGVLLLFSCFSLWWWQRAPARSLVLLGLACIGISYLLIYSARANFSYVGQIHGWSRYH